MNSFNRTDRIEFQSLCFIFQILVFISYIYFMKKKIQIIIFDRIFMSFKSDAYL